jgi:hypothetical protein
MGTRMQPQTYLPTYGCSLEFSIFWFFQRD